MTAMISRSEGMHKTSEIFWMTTLIDQLIIRRDQCGNDVDDCKLERVKYYGEKNGHYVEYIMWNIQNSGLSELWNAKTLLGIYDPDI